MRLRATPWPLFASNWAFSECGQLLPRQSLHHQRGSKSEKETVWSEMIVFREPMVFQRLAFFQGTQELFQRRQEILDPILVQPIRRTSLIRQFKFSFRMDSYFCQPSARRRLLITSLTEVNEAVPSAIVFTRRPTSSDHSASMLGSIVGCRE